MRINENWNKRNNQIKPSNQQIYGGAIFVPEMEEFLGKGAVITEVLFPVFNANQGSYGLSIDQEQIFEFTDEMLELAEVA